MTYFFKPNLYKKVALFTTVERYNDDQFINHHGFQRNVKENVKELENLKNKTFSGAWMIPDFTKTLNLGEIAKIIGQY